jgi:hypothetical protein
MDSGHPGLRTFVAAVVLIVGACSASSSTPTPSRTIVAAGPTSSPGPTALPVVTQAPEPESTSEPAPVSSPTPAPPRPPASATGWTKPKLVSNAKCSTVTAGIDGASRYHIAAACDDGHIHYFVSNAAGSWTTTVLSHPANRRDLDPQIAFHGSVVYVAYSQIAPDEGCGSNGRDVGVYFRSRTLPSGAWSDATRIGSATDRLQSFRVDGISVQATVQNATDGHDYYETLDGGSAYDRFLIPGATERTSLRIGSDGRARIAYQVLSGGLGYALFTGAGFSTSRIPGTKERDWAPVLVLDAHDNADVLWTRSPYGGHGCAVPGPEPDDGTYYATNASGTWVSHRITRAIGAASLQVDNGTGRLHVLVSGVSGLSYFTSLSGSRWTRTTVSSTDSAQSPLLRLDPATGSLLGVYIDGSNTGSARIYALTKP